MELVNAQESQYTRVKNEERWNRLEQEFYPALCVIAKTQGGRVELNIKEDTLIGQLVYIGEGLTLGSSNPEGLAAFSRIVAAAEDIFVSIHDGCSKFQFIFCLHDKVFVEDHAEQIAKKKSGSTVWKLCGFIGCFQARIKDRESTRILQNSKNIYGLRP